MKKIDDVLKALSDETRLRIINLLFSQELCVCDIVEILEITQTKASRHLQYLKNASLVEDKKYAQWVHYSMADISDMKFLNDLIVDNIRKQEPFKSDLKKLEKRLKNKKTTCD